jgi:alpha-glucosidase
LAFVDAAARMNLEFVTVDAGWEDGFVVPGKTQFDRLADLVRYGHEAGRHVDIWVWKDMAHLFDADTRQRFFAAIRTAGGVGVKVDEVYLAPSDSITYVRLQEAILRDAAQQHLMINLHGVGKSTGMSRTYPNQITREGLLGLETNTFWNIGFFVPPSQAAIAPFVRLVDGPADFTPVTLDPRKVGATTFAHQIALAGLITSPLQTFAESPSVLAAHPEALDVLLALPTEWDETVVLEPSRIGGVAVFARRKGTRWHLFVANGNSAAPTAVNIPMSVFGSGSFELTLLSDDTPVHLARTVERLNESDVLALTLLPGGGCVGLIDPDL